MSDNTQKEQEVKPFDDWYIQNLRCPVDQSILRQDGAFLISLNGRRYPIVDGIPVMLRDDVSATIGVADASLYYANKVAQGQHVDNGLFLKTAGISEAERIRVRQLEDEGGVFDPLVSVIVGATSGYAYKHLVGQKGYSPIIPIFRFVNSEPGTLLDIGCNWGRWTISASKAGYSCVGIDPSLAAVLAARRLAAQLGVAARFVVGDARYLPFRAEFFDYAWSYSVLQHFSRLNARLALREIARVCRHGGRAKIQMANAVGVRSFYHMARRKFREPSGFEVRYWSPGELSGIFSEDIGETNIEADCFLGLGLQWSDFSYMTAMGKLALIISEGAKRASQYFTPLAWFADSLFCTSKVR